MGMDMIGQGIKYVPLLIDMCDKDKIVAMENVLGEVAPWRWVKLLAQKVYKEEGYFAKWDEKKSVIYAQSKKIDLEWWQNFLDFCFEYEMFDRDMYDSYGILTSETIQDNYMDATKRYRKVNLIWEYCLLHPDKYKSTDKQHKVVVQNIEGDTLNIDELTPKKKKAAVQVFSAKPEKEFTTKDAIDFIASMKKVEEKPECVEPPVEVKPMIKDVTLEPKDKPFYFSDALAFCAKDYEKESDLFRKQIGIIDWFETYKSIIFCIRDNYPNLQSSSMHLTFKDYKDWAIKYRPKADEIERTLEWFSRKGDEKRDLIRSRLSQYLTYVREEASKK